MTKIIKDPNSDRLLSVAVDGSLAGGFFAVDPSGHLVSLDERGNAKLKSGWKWATDADVKAADAAESKRVDDAKPKTKTAPAAKS